MFRPLRRKKQALSQEDCEAVLRRGTGGVLALRGDEDYPYAVPLSYLYEDGRIFFHSAVSGHKIDALRSWDKASFCVIDEDRPVGEDITTYYRSVIVFGRMREITGPEEKKEAVYRLALRYFPDRAEQLRAAAQRDSGHMAMLELEIEHMSGKAAMALMKKQ